MTGAGREEAAAEEVRRADEELRAADALVAVDLPRVAVTRAWSTPRRRRSTSQRRARSANGLGRCSRRAEREAVAPRLEKLRHAVTLISKILFGRASRGGNESLAQCHVFGRGKEDKE